VTVPNHTNDVGMSIINSSLSFSKLSFSNYLIQILQGNCTRTRHGQLSHASYGHIYELNSHFEIGHLHHRTLASHAKGSDQ
jgi:hypothetical protein